MAHSQVPGKALLTPNWVLFLFVFLVAASAHGCLIFFYGTALPFWDEWDGIGLRLFLPHLQHTLSLDRLFAAHNEHRIVLTRLQSLAIFDVSGRWDLLSEMTLNCIWYGLAVFFFAAAQLSSANSHPSRLMPFLTAAVFALPFDWQNALWGFQSQNFFALLFAAIVIWAECRQPSKPINIWLILLAGLLSLFSNAAGLFTVISVFWIHVVFCLLGQQSWKKSLPILVGSGIICCLGLILRVEVPANNYLRPKTVSVFVQVLGSCLAWPSIDQPIVALMAYLPVVLFTFQSFRQPARFSRNDRVLVWIPASLGILSAIGITYARGNGLPDNAPLSRYHEMLAVGALANGHALFQLRPTALSSKWKSRWLLLCSVWFVLFIMGAIRLSMVNFGSHLPFKIATGRSQTELLTRYARSHDPSILDGRSLFEIGHTDVKVIEEVISNPLLAPVLPTPLQASAKPTLLESCSNILVRSSPVIFPFSFAMLLLSAFPMKNFRSKTASSP